MHSHQISSEVRKVIWPGDCYHIITADNEREIVTNEAVQFIKRHGVLTAPLST